MLKSKTLPIAAIVAMMVVCQPLQAQTAASKTVNQTQSEIQQLRDDVESLRSENSQLRNEVSQLSSNVNRFQSTLADKADTGLILSFFGVFCALWAQNTRRNPWLWFFLGIFFHFLTGLVLLSKNATDFNSNRQL
jgi:TolA-binding protein